MAHLGLPVMRAGGNNLFSLVFSIFQLVYDEISNTFYIFAGDNLSSMIAETIAYVVNAPRRAVRATVVGVEIFLMFAAASCVTEGVSDPTLDEVEALVATRPDSAAVLWGCMETFGFGNEERARYAQLDSLIHYNISTTFGPEREAEVWREIKQKTEAELNRRNHFYGTLIGTATGLLILVLASAFLTSAVIATFVYKRKRREKRSLLEKIAALQRQVDSLAAQEREAGDAGKVWSAAEEEKILVLKKEQVQLCLQMLQLRKEYKRLKAISSASAPALTARERALLTRIISNEFATVIDGIRTDCFLLTAEDAFYCVLSCIGYDTKACATLMGKSVPTLRDQKSRIKKKVTPAFSQFFFGK